MSRDDVLAALEAQTDRLDAILHSLDAKQWSAPSLCPGWTVTDVVLHLAQTEEGVAATITGRDLPARPVSGGTVDEIIEHWVQTERGAPPAEVHARWNRARGAALEALRSADPDKRFTWVAAPLRPTALATTRLSEHWIHTMDIAEPLGIDNPDTDDIRHLAWLAVMTVPYAFKLAGRGGAPSVRAELTAPSGAEWVIGPEDADVVITGPASEFVRVAARRMPAREAKDVTARGERSTEVLELIRTYA